MIFVAGTTPPRELDGEPWAPLPPPGKRHKAGPAPYTLIAVGDGARELLPWLRDPAALLDVDAVLLVNPATGSQAPASIVAWQELARRAAAGDLALAVWASYQAPQRPRLRHPYDAVWLLQGATTIAGVDLQVDARALVDWPAGEVLCGPAGEAWDRPPSVKVHARGGFVAVVDTGTPPEASPALLAALYGPGALVRGVLAPWRATTARPAPPPPAPRPPRPSAAPPSPRRRRVGEDARHAAAELDDAIDGAEALGRSVVRGVHAGVGLVGEARALWQRLRVQRLRG